MPREADPYREHVKFLSKTTWNCNFCGNQYAGSATRIKAHLAGVGGYGIHGCKVVDAQVRSEALKALKGKIAVESSNRQGNVEEGPHQPVAASNEDGWREISFAAVPYLSSDVISTVGASSSAFLRLPNTNLPSQSFPARNVIRQRDTSLWPQPPESHSGDSYIQPWNVSYPSSRGDPTPETLTNMTRPLNAEEGEPNTEVPQDARTDGALVNSQVSTRGLADGNMKRKLKELSSREADMDELETWYRKAKRIKGEYRSMVQAFREGRSLSLQQVKRVDDLIKEVEEILGHDCLQKGSTTQVMGCRKSSPLLTTKLVGVESENKIKMICDYLMEDEILVVGAYGMGGVGKTAILMHVHNRLLLENPAFNDVFWVSVPKKLSVYELQNEIANAVGLDDLSKYKDVKKRACMLHRHLKKKRSVLILDGLWMHFEVEDVGIPLEKGGLKLVLTSRSLDVCRKMLCQMQIKIQLLDWPHDWSLFLEKLCFKRELPLEVEEIARSIVDKCEGLPLGIIEIATRMRGVEKVHEWKDMLQKLENSRMELDVFKRLKLSYMNLGNPLVQQCFLHLVLCFGEDLSEINREDLIESFIDESLLGGTATRQELHKQGNIILDKIREACLWDDLEEEYQYVHPLIRDMTLQIVTSTTHMIKAKMRMYEIPGEEFWTNHLEKVLLPGNGISEIPNGISPNCPKLTRLSLNDNHMLTVVHESFFGNLNGLKVLDLSSTGIAKLPDSISHLESLEALLLQGCWELRRIPYVGKLRFLRKLDLNGCASLGEVPEGMEMLVKLTYLDLDGTEIKMLPEGVLAKLVNLQYLAIQEVRAGEDTKLKVVEALYCCVPNVKTFNACVKFLEQNSSHEYQLALNVSIGRGDYERHIIIEGCDRIAASVDGEIGGDGCALLPESVQVLEVGLCCGVSKLCDIGPLENLEELKIEEWEKLEDLGPLQFPHLLKLNITECSKLKHLLEWEWLTTGLPSLDLIHIFNCEKLEEIIAGPLPSGATCRLRCLEIIGCDNIKRELLTCDLLPHLPSLQTIRVESCKGIEVIMRNVATFTYSSALPKLTHLTLKNLPKLRRVCDGTMSCDSSSGLM